MLMMVRYIARSDVTYPAPNKVMAIVVSLVENNLRGEYLFHGYCISARFQIYA